MTVVALRIYYVDFTTILKYLAIDIARRQLKKKKFYYIIGKEKLSTKENINNYLFLFDIDTAVLVIIFPVNSSNSSW